jgi:hypothetical protein
MAKRFMYVCLGLLALVVAFHLGATSAESTAEGPFVSLVSEWQWGYMLAMTGQGDIYFSTEYGGPFPEWHYWGTIPTGATATEPTTWGRIKAEFGE